jgi:hypothetical protein
MVLSSLLSPFKIPTVPVATPLRPTLSQRRMVARHAPGQSAHSGAVAVQNSTRDEPHVAATAIRRSVAPWKVFGAATGLFVLVALDARESRGVFRVAALKRALDNDRPLE